jgi:hypothetical protein
MQVLLDHLSKLRMYDFQYYEFKADHSLAQDKHWRKTQKKKKIKKLLIGARQTPPIKQR